MITFFWRCEGTTLTTDADYSAGDTSATVVGTATIDTTGVRVGTNGLRFPGSGDQFRFTPTGLINTAAGCIGFSIYFPSSPSSGTTIMVVRDAAGDDRIYINTDTGDIRFGTITNSVQQFEFSSATSMSTGSWYGVIVRWDSTVSRQCIELYDSNNVIIEKKETTTSFTPASQSDINATSTGIRIGPDTSSLAYIDNIFFSDDYDEPIQDNFLLTTILEYKNEISYDTATENVRTNTASPQTFSHAAASSGVSGVILCLVHGTSATDHVSAASYGGTAMTRIQRNTDTATEPGAAEIWFLGSSIPQGTQTVSYTPGSTSDDIHAVCITLLSNGDCEVVDNDGVDDNVANPSVNLDTSGNRWMITTGALYGGGASPSAFTPNSTHRTVDDHDLGAFYSEVITLVTPTRSTGFAVGGTSSSDDVAFAAIAVSRKAKPRSFSTIV